MNINEYNYENISKGMVFKFERVLTDLDLANFASLTGDYNPLHCDVKYAKDHGFKNKVVYGMLAGSLFSSLLGMICPGRKNLYLSQDLNFKKPIYLDTNLVVRGEVIDKFDSTKVLVIKTQIISGNDIMVDGLAKVKVIN